MESATRGAVSVQITLDAAEPKSLAAFWREALGYVDQAPPDGFDSWDSALEAWHVPQEEREDHWALVDPRGLGPRVFFQRVPEPKTAKNRVHLDLNASAAGTAAEDRRVRAEALADRLAELGARRDRVHDDGEFWIVMSDPEGNEFCVQ